MSVNSAIKSPLTRPVLPRTSSGTSGFFFCGMMDEPVQKRSGRWMKSNCAEDHRINSSEKRERFVSSSAAAAQNSNAKTQTHTATSENTATTTKPKNCAVYV